MVNYAGPQPQVVLGTRRTLKIGDVYRDGWKLQSVSASTITLAKDTETRRIGVVSPPVPAANAQAASATGSAAAPVLSLSNNLREGQLTGSQLNAVANTASRLGLPPDKVQALRAQLLAGTVNQQSITQLMQGIRPPPSAPAIQAFLRALADAGVINQQQAQAMGQSLPQMLAQQAQQRPNPPPAGPPQININRGPGNAGPGNNQPGRGPGFQPGGGNAGRGPGPGGGPNR